MRLAAKGLVGIALSILVACTNPCLKPGYVRSARGSSDYVLDGKLHGLGPETFSVRGFDPFGGGHCTDPEPVKMLELELGPACRLRGRVMAHRHNMGGRRSNAANQAFLQAEALILENQSCALTLAGQYDGAHEVRGKVESGTLVLLPASASATVYLDLDEVDGIEKKPWQRLPLRISLTGNWWPMEAERRVACAQN